MVTETKLPNESDNDSLGSANIALGFDYAGTGDRAGPKSIGIFAPLRPITFSKIPKSSALRPVNATEPPRSARHPTSSSANDKLAASTPVQSISSDSLSLHAPRTPSQNSPATILVAKLRPRLAALNTVIVFALSTPMNLSSRNHHTGKRTNGIVAFASVYASI